MDNINCLLLLVIIVCFYLLIKNWKDDFSEKSLVSKYIQPPMNSYNYGLRSETSVIESAMNELKRRREQITQHLNELKNRKKALSKIKQPQILNTGFPTLPNGQLMMDTAQQYGQPYQPNRENFVPSPETPTDIYDAYLGRRRECQKEPLKRCPNDNFGLYPSQEAIYSAYYNVGRPYGTGSIKDCGYKRCP